MSDCKRIIIAYYINPSLGSDFRVGYEYVNFASINGFDCAITSDLNENISDIKPDYFYKKLKLIKIKSIVKNHQTLMKVNDFVPQLIWHFNVYRWINKNCKNVDIIWISCSSAQLWFPLKLYLKICKKLIWGPIGGGGIPSSEILQKFSLKTLIRERLRAIIDGICFQIKVDVLTRNRGTIFLMVRTAEMKKRIEKFIPGYSAEFFPEFINLIRPKKFTRRLISEPKFIWVGQDIPRKDLGLGIEIFRRLKEGYFKNSTLDIYGVEGESLADEGIKYLGWIKGGIDWAQYTNSGVLILSSYREGLSTVLIEALSNGLFAIATPVGAIPLFKFENIYVLSPEDHVSLDDNTIFKIAKEINLHLSKIKWEVSGIDYSPKLSKFIKKIL